MAKREQEAGALERKILRAIERGEFTPARGYLRAHVYIGFGIPSTVVGPCGCAIAAAASVKGFDVDVRGFAGQDELVAYLKTVGLKPRDSLALESGYEGDFVQHSTNPYFQVGKRLRRFHPNTDGRVEA